MDRLCTKDKNIEKIKKLLPQNEMQSLIISQMIWDKNCDRGMNVIFKKLKTNQYGWNWIADDLTEDDTEEVKPGALTCNRCNSNLIKTRMYQTRSCDEGQTVFAQCVTCGNVWRCVS